MSVVTLLRQVRERRGVGVAELAAKAGASRQTIYAIEAGTYTPNAALALRLARALEATVEELFRLEDEAAGAGEAEFLPDEEAPAEGQPVRLAKVGERLVASAAPGELWQFPEFDALATGARGVRETAAGQRLERLAMAGCDPAMSLLARHLLRERVEMIATPRNSARALELLEGGWVHVAGTHRREAAGESNEGAVRKAFPRGGVAIYSLAVWEQGLVVAKGNPKGITGVADLARRDVKVVNREAGAGSRVLLDVELERLGIAPAQVRGYGEFAGGHLQAALRVKRGEADCCVAPRAAARLYGLDFLPLWSERYDLVIRKEHAGLPAVERLIEVLQRPAFQAEMEALGGYDTRVTGKRRK